MARGSLLDPGGGRWGPSLGVKRWVQENPGWGPTCPNLDHSGLLLQGDRCSPPSCIKPHWSACTSPPTASSWGPVMGHCSASTSRPESRCRWHAEPDVSVCHKCTHTQTHWLTFSLTTSHTCTCEHIRIHTHHAPPFLFEPSISAGWSPSSPLMQHQRHSM